MSVTLYSEIKDGNISDACFIKMRSSFQQFEGQRIQINIDKYKKKRSNNQNAYWFGILNKYVVPVFRKEGCNLSDYDIHQYIMEQLGYTKVSFLPNGEIVRVRDRSSRFKTVDWEEFMDRARALLAEEFEIYLPLPREFNHVE